MSRRLIIDMSSIMWTCLLAGQDKEWGVKVDFNGKPTLVNSAQYGYENAVNHLVAVLDSLHLTPMNMIMVVEGMNSKFLRTSILPTYKGGTAPSHPEQAYVEFNKLRGMLLETFLGLGACWCSQDGIESDDVMTYLALNLKGERIIDTNDNDLTAIVDNDNGIRVWKFGKGLVEDNPYGPFPFRHITVYKALVGDPSDKIPGAKGFGPTAWNNLLIQFGYEGLDLMEGLIRDRQLDRLAEDVGTLKELQRIIDNKDTVYKSYDCARLYPMKVNTMRKPLEWKAGMVRSRSEIKDERLRHWGQQVRLVSEENFKAACDFLSSKMEESPVVSLDIETSTSDESDDWLEQAKAKSQAAGDDIGVDVFGSTLTGFSLTFGCNMQYTYYVTVDHVEEQGVTNISREQAKHMMNLIPESKRHIIQNVAFELPVLMKNLGPMDEEGVIDHA